MSVSEREWHRRWARQCGALAAATVIAAVVVLLIGDSSFGWLSDLADRLAIAVLLVLAWPACIACFLVVIGLSFPSAAAVVALLLVLLLQWGVIGGIGAAGRRLKLDVFYGGVLVAWVTVGILLCALFSMAKDWPG